MRKLYDNLKQRGKLAAASVVGLAATAPAAFAEDNGVTTAMNAIKSDATSMVGSMVPIVLGILGVGLGAMITVSLFKKLSTKAA